MKEVRRVSLVEQMRRSRVRGESSVVAPEPRTCREVLWSGHFYDYSGYGKFNRELLLRVASSFRVELRQDRVAREHVTVDDYTRRRLSLHKQIRVGPKAPLVRLYTPLPEEGSQYKVCYTMMETEQIHADFVGRINGRYDELWMPTQWNLDRMNEAGLSIPGRVMPGGINPHTFRPMASGEIPECELLTTSRCGTLEVPEGFLFVTVFLPTFRKGVDVLIDAFEQAFGNDDEAALILGVTSHPAGLSRLPLWGSLPPSDHKARIYALSGRFLEEELARIYNACHAYVSTSRGEGWGLPLTEAAACGLPVIAPMAFSYTEYLDSENAFTFETDGVELIPGMDKVCPWYKGIPFAKYGPKATSRIVSLMREVKNDYEGAVVKGERLMKLIHEKYTWDLSASRIVERLVEIVEA